jgi:hypothetical protein
MTNDKELNALAAVARALEGMTREQVRRILDYAAARSGIDPRTQFVPYLNSPPYVVTPTFTPTITPSTTTWTGVDDYSATWTNAADQGPIT